MGKGKGKGGQSKVTKSSSGGRHIARLNQQMGRLRLKIKRWERYLKEGKDDKRWNPDGLKSHLKLLESFI